MTSRRKRKPKSILGSSGKAEEAQVFFDEKNKNSEFCKKKSKKIEKGIKKS